MGGGGLGERGGGNRSRTPTPDAVLGLPGSWPGHEEQVGALARELGFRHVSLSSAVAAMVRAVPRGYTACADAYLTPCIHRYLESFRAGFAHQLRVSGAAGTPRMGTHPGGTSPVDTHPARTPPWASDPPGTPTGTIPPGPSGSAHPTGIPPGRLSCRDAPRAPIPRGPPPAGGAGAVHALGRGAHPHAALQRGPRHPLGPGRRRGGLRHDHLPPRGRAAGHRLRHGR